MLRGLISATILIVGAMVGSAGCNDGTDFRGAGLGNPNDGANADGAEAPGSTPLAARTCGGQSAPVEKLGDPSTLPACAPACGGAHCVPADTVPAVSQSFFAKCGGGFCLPDPLIASGGARPPQCKSLNNAEGVCLGLCVPQVAENKDILPRATCAEDERCAPCVNPNDGTDTGACAIGTQLLSSAPNACAGGGAAAPAPGAGQAPDLSCPHVGAPVLDPGTLPVCGARGNAAHCLPARLTPSDLTSKLAPCAGGFCVPDKLIASGGRFIPKTCTSIGNAEGRCQSMALPSVATQASQLKSAGCDADELCVPCTNPLDGTDTGACRTSCDPGAKTPPVVFPACCGNAAKCIPQALIPAGKSDHLTGNGCPGGSLCVPNENIDPNFVAPSCQGNGFLGFDYSGFCASNCVDFGNAGSFLNQGTCSGGHTCVSN
jgi:hypothetical protein